MLSQEKDVKCTCLNVTCQGVQIVCMQLKSPLRGRHEAAVRARVAEAPEQKNLSTHDNGIPDPDVLYDAIIVGGGMGGLTTASQMASKGARVLLLEK